MTMDYVVALARESQAFVSELARDPLLGSVIRGEADHRKYVQFLVGSYQYVRWSGFLLTKTAEGLRRSARYPKLHEAVDAKAKEEGPHDRWLLADLRNCGVDPAPLMRAALPDAVTEYLTQSLRFAQAGSPAFLGAAYTLEFISMQCASRAAASLRTRRAIPNIERALSFLDGHGVADRGHIAELEATLESIDRAQDHADILALAGVMRDLYPDFFAPVESTAELVTEFEPGGMPCNRFA